MAKVNYSCQSLHEGENYKGVYFLHMALSIRRIFEANNCDHTPAVYLDQYWGGGVHIANIASFCYFPPSALELEKRIQYRNGFRKNEL